MAKGKSRPPSRNGSGGKFKTAAAAVAGGAVGALGGGLLVRTGVNVKTAAIGIVAGGAALAMTTSGPMRAAAYGAAAAGAGQLALGWLADRAAKKDAQKAQTTPQVQEQPKRQGLSGYDPREAFEDARQSADAWEEDMAA